jgi:hypothetical protein
MWPLHRAIAAITKGANMSIPDEILCSHRMFRSRMIDDRDGYLSHHDDPSSIDRAISSEIMEFPAHGARPSVRTD